jgi:CHAT domain-containing protein
LILAEAEQEARQSAEHSNQLLIEAEQKVAKRIRSSSIILFVTLGAALLISILASQFVRSSTQRAELADKQAAITSQKAEQSIRNANAQKQESEKDVRFAQSKLDTANRQVEEADQNLTSAKAKLAIATSESKEEIERANQEVQDAEIKVSQALQEQQQAQKEVKEQISKSQSEKQKIQIEIDKKATEFAKLTTEFDQARNQMRLAQQAIVESVGDTPARIERQTGQRPAIVYISFINSENGKGDDTLGILMITAQGQVSKQISIKASELNILIEKFRQELLDTVSNDFLESSQKLYEILIKPIDLDLQKQKINNLVFITDNSALRFISLAALHDGKQFLVEKYSVGVMPGLNLTDTRYKDLKNANILAMGISKPIYNFSALPSIEIELSNIKSVWKSNVDIFLNEEFTIDNFRLQRQNKNFQIIYIATHAGLNVRDLDKSFLLLWNKKLELSRFDELGLEQFPLELLVLSTGYSGIGTISKDTKFGFAGKAIQSGTKSVLASLTSVSDEGTTTLMTEFYKQLKTAPTKSEALRKAQVSMLKKSKNFSHPYYWASFTIIGNPW